jgi:hypothetical protein
VAEATCTGGVFWAADNPSVRVAGELIIEVGKGALANLTTCAQTRGSHSSTSLTAESAASPGPVVTITSHQQMRNNLSNPVQRRSFYLFS